MLSKFQSLTLLISERNVCPFKLSGITKRCKHLATLGVSLPSCCMLSKKKKIAKRITRSLSTEQKSICRQAECKNVVCSNMSEG